MSAHGGDGGGSGWEGFGLDEGKRALEVHHNRAALFQDAAEDDDTDALEVSSASKTGAKHAAGFEGGSKNGAWQKKILVGLLVVISAIPAIVIGLLFTGNDISKAFSRNNVKTEVYAFTDIGGQIEMPGVYDHLADSKNRPTSNHSYVPLLWDIPGDGDSVQHVLSNCMGLVAAGGAIDDPRQTESQGQPLEVFETHGRWFVNVHTSSLEGIERAKRLDLVGSGLADVVYAPLIYEVGSIFTDAHPGKLFAMFHHPVHRVMSVYHISHNVRPVFYNATLADFLDQPEGWYNNNWMTRELSGGRAGELNEDHFQIAKEVLREKCLMGLTTELSESFQRFYTYFGWKPHNDNFDQCEKRVMEGDGLDRIYFDLVEENSLEWALIAERNYWDLRLYEFSTMLFKTQGRELFSEERDE